MYDTFLLGTKNLSGRVTRTFVNLLSCSDSSTISWHSNYFAMAASWHHTIKRKPSIQKVTLSWRMKMAYQSYTTCKKSFQVAIKDIYEHFNPKVSLFYIASLLFILLIWQSCLTFLDEWTNFLERITCKNESEVWENEENILQLRHWVSLRGQTLCRTGNSCNIFSFKFVYLPLQL